VNNTKTNTFGPAKSAGKQSKKNPFDVKLKKAMKEYAASIDPDLGIVPDRIIASRTKLSRHHVGYIRSRLGITYGVTSKKSKIVEAHESGVIDLRTMSSREVLDVLKIGASSSLVSNARQDLGIWRGLVPPITKPDKPPTTRENNDLLNRAWR
jgi:hypothetical protein